MGSDIWTLGITVAYLTCGKLLFDSHEPGQIVELMAEALGPFPRDFLSTARDARVQRFANMANDWAADPALADWLGFASGYSRDSPEALLVDLVRQMLALDPAARITAKAALRHKLFKADVP